jgi:hypothetical protein
VPPAEVVYVEKQPSLEDIFLALIGHRSEAANNIALAATTIVTTAEPDWLSRFTRVHDRPAGASDDELFALSGWWPSARAMPDDYRSFLRWSNGPAVDWYDWSFGFFSTVDIVTYHAEYNFRTYMADAVPIGFDGGGVFACYDVRGLADGMPIVMASAGNLGFEDARFVAATLFEFTGRAR